MITKKEPSRALMFETILFQNCLGHTGASDGTQTRGLFLGKEALYQLSYTRLTDTDYILKMLFIQRLIY